LALARDGADIAINGRHADEEAMAVVAQIRALGRRAELVVADCSEASQCAAMVERTTALLGQVDVLIHCAGGPVNGGLFDLTAESWHGAFDTHLHAVFHLARAVIPGMKARREGAILLVSSTAGIRGVITNVAYQVVKGALPQFTRALAREFADDNIRINCVAPGVIRTDFHKSMSEEQRRLNLEKRIPLHREGTPDNVASVILELVKNDYITGETVTIDGGLTMRIA
jgi:NAD(P)-dependent dehydrogenase (short-subunit alcohol dehydrogenase family)